MRELKNGSGDGVSRRRFVAQSVAVSGAGLLAGCSKEEEVLLAWAERKQPAVSRSSGPVGDMPRGKIGKLSVSRIICGGNLFSGFAHSRELIYVSSLMKHYFTPEKIMDTLEQCERYGINTAILRCDEHIVSVLERYRKERGGKILWIAQTYPTVAKPTENIQLAIDHGAVGAFMQGANGDQLIKEGHMDVMAKILAFMRQNGLAAGVGSHSLDTPRSVEKEKLEPDFYFKTFNSVAYHSQEPAEIADFMKSVGKPWVAFKVLGAGVVAPKDGFRLAFSSGADFLNVGMFDFQVAENARLASSLLASDLSRQRPWCS